MNPPGEFGVIAQLVCGQIGNFLAGGIVVLLLTEIFAHLVREGRSAARFVVWFGGLIAMAALPLIAIAEKITLHTEVAGAAKISLPASWARYAFVAWLIVAGFAFMRIAAGFLQMCSLRRRSLPLAVSTLAPELQKTVGKFQSGRSVAILLSDEIQSPTAIGLVKPAIVLPNWVKDELTTAELQQILLHELAHLRRWDDWSNLLQKVLKAFFFFHPAVWRMEWQLSLEREMACDEAVLAHTENPRAYAECLVHLAEKGFLRRSLLLAQAAVSRLGQTSKRITRILTCGKPSSASSWKLIAPSLVGVLAVSVASLDRMPRLIAFTDDAPAVAANQSAQLALPAVVKASFIYPIRNQSAESPLKMSRTKFPAKEAVLKTRKLNSVGSLVVSTGFRIETCAGREQMSNARAIRASWSRGTEPCGFLIVFIENSPNRTAVPVFWQIQMWQVTVLRTMKNPAAQIISQKVI